MAWLLIVVAGVVLFLAGDDRREATALVVGRNLPINVGAVDKRDISANNSPSAVANPTDPDNLVVSNRVDLPRFSCALHHSLDGGATFRATTIPFPEGEEAPPRCFAPDVAFDTAGVLYVSFATLIGFGNQPNAIWLVKSSDGGRTLSVPTRVLGRLAFQTRLSADPTRAGRLYLSWLQAETTANLSFPTPGNPINVARSDDGGATWGPPVQVNPATRGRVIAPSTAVGGDGAVYVVYLDLGDDALDYHGAHEGKGGDAYAGKWSLLVARSGDEGSTWAETVVDTRLVPIERFIVFTPPTPSIAVGDDHGEVFVSFHDASLGDADVWVWSSGNGGVSFWNRRRVNDTPTGDGTSQYLPKLSVAPNGRIDVVYYDRRQDSKNLRNSVSLQSSKDDGTTFGPRVRITDMSFDSRVGFGNARGMPDLGSRLGLVSTNDRAMAVWTDTRGGTEASNKQDVARGVVAFTPAASLRDPLRLGGAALAGLGVLGTVSSLARRRRRRRRSGTPGASPEHSSGSGVTAAPFVG
ncbi:MAG TPA: sialidase family protein [Acidimicrobiales bacterium]|nr:sialidase family protein [Acidimicrobiales bacterium]